MPVLCQVSAHTLLVKLVNSLFWALEGGGGVTNIKMSLFIMKCFLAAWVHCYVSNVTFVCCLLLFGVLTFMPFFCVDEVASL